MLDIPCGFRDHGELGLMIQMPQIVYLQTYARESQLMYAEKVKLLDLEICQDCMAGLTAEEVGSRLGMRSL